MQTNAPTITKTTWQIDPDRSSVEFRVKTFYGLATVKGRFSRYHGTLDLSEEPAIELTIEAGSLDTRNKRRDKHLRSEDFFGAERYPYVRFVSERAALDGDRLTVRGRLHARGASAPVDVDAKLRRDGDGLEDRRRRRGRPAELGMTMRLLGLVGRPSTLIVQGPAHLLRVARYRRRGPG